jgi:hypothetical protein
VFRYDANVNQDIITRGQLYIIPTRHLIFAVTLTFAPNRVTEWLQGGIQRKQSYTIEYKHYRRAAFITAIAGLAISYSSIAREICAKFDGQSYFLLVRWSG